jgi:hypothetical protein
VGRKATSRQRRRATTHSGLTPGVGVGRLTGSLGRAKGRGSIETQPFTPSWPTRTVLGQRTPPGAGVERAIQRAILDVQGGAAGEQPIAEPVEDPPRAPPGRGPPRVGGLPLPAVHPLRHEGGQVDQLRDLGDRGAVRHEVGAAQDRRYDFGGRDSDACTITCSTRCPSGETITSTRDLRGSGWCLSQPVSANSKGRRHVVPRFVAPAPRAGPAPPAARVPRVLCPVGPGQGRCCSAAHFRTAPMYASLACCASASRSRSFWISAGSSVSAIDPDSCLPNGWRLSGIAVWAVASASSHRSRSSRTSWSAHHPPCSLPFNPPTTLTGRTAHALRLRWRIGRTRQPSGCPRRRTRHTVDVSPHSAWREPSRWPSGAIQCTRGGRPRAHPAGLPRSTRHGATVAAGERSG